MKNNNNNNNNNNNKDLNEIFYFELSSFNLDYLKSKLFPIDFKVGVPYYIQLFLDTGGRIGHSFIFKFESDDIEEREKVITNLYKRIHNLISYLDKSYYDPYNKRGFSLTISNDY